MERGRKLKGLLCWMSHETCEKMFGIGKNMGRRPKVWVEELLFGQLDGNQQFVAWEGSRMGEQTYILLTFSL
tara:strand:+ start:452 stop:667 length:216 start_codon:yes stop_codon:yes gene_type:complete